MKGDRIYLLAVGLGVLLTLAVSLLDPFNAFASPQLDDRNGLAHYRKWHASGVCLGLREVHNCEVNIGDGLVCGLVSAGHHETVDVVIPFDRSRCLASSKFIQDFSASQVVDGCRKRWHDLWGGGNCGLPADYLIRDRFNDNQERSVLFKIGEDSSRDCMVVKAGKTQRPVTFHLFFYRLPPSIGEPLGQSIRCTFVGQLGKLLSGDCKAVPQGGARYLIPSSSPSGSSEYQFVAKCGDFTLSVGIGVGGGLPTISGNDNLILRPVGDNYRAIGFHLRGCTQTGSRKDEAGNSHPFHLLILSTDASGGAVSRHGLETCGSRLFLSKDGYHWYEVVRSGE